MLEYGGYSTRRSLASLQNKEELENLFVFIRDMAEDMDEDERKEVLGVFRKNPQKLCIIPGCSAIFKQFLEVNKSESNATEKDQPQSSRANNNATSSRKSETTVSTSAADIDESVTEASVGEQLEQWLSKEADEAVVKERLSNCKKSSVSDTFSMRWTADDRRCVCNVCSQTITLPKKKMKDRVVLSISNVTRHISSYCWKKPDFELPKVSKDKRKQTSLQAFYKKPAARPTFVNPASTAIDFHASPVNTNENERAKESQDFHASPINTNENETAKEPQDANQVEISDGLDAETLGEVASKRTKLESTIDRISRQGMDSKNLHPPAGI